MPPDKPPASPDGLARLAGQMMLVGGAATLVCALLGYAWWNDKIPRSMGYANLGGAVIELGLAIGILGKRRAAWAFGVSLAVVLTVVNLLGLAQLSRAGTAGGVSIALAAMRVAMAALLIESRKSFS